MTEHFADICITSVVHFCPSEITVKMLTSVQFFSRDSLSVEFLMSESTRAKGCNLTQNYNKSYDLHLIAPSEIHLFIAYSGR